MFKWIKEQFTTEDIFFELDKSKEYTDDELIEIISTKILRIGTGNLITLKLLKNLNKRVKELESERR